MESFRCGVGSEIVERRRGLAARRIGTAISARRRFVLWFELAVERRAADPPDAIRARHRVDAPNRRDDMLAPLKGVFASATAALTVVAALAFVANANAQTPQKPAPRQVRASPLRAPRELPLAPGVDLSASTSAAEGTENHYFTDTVGSSHTDLMDQGFRYGQAPSPRFDSGEPLFRF
jgi:hypothetical protein